WYCSRKRNHYGFAAWHSAGSAEYSLSTLAQATTDKPRATSERIAPAQFGEANPNPAAIVAPPIHAPSAFPKLNIPMFTDAAIVGAPARLARSITNFWIGETVAKPKAAMRNTETEATIPLLTPIQKTNSTAACAASVTNSVPNKDRSAKRPPIQLPTTSPSPKSTISRAMPASENPASSTIIGAI